MVSLDRRAKGLHQQSASACGMQATGSRVPTAKQGDLSQKQRPTAWTGPSPIAKFLRCLRLLDLDLLEDWPGISEDTFSTLATKQNLQARIKCVEWSLYRLLEIWSPSETGDKLRPFFPPLTPLQSLNLRAALYRSLTELKKGGVLGRDFMLRRTMLDECKGEKFEELISAFAMTVLRRSASARGDSWLKLACSDRLTDQPQAQLLPLIIAHRNSLHKQLSNHGKIRAQAEMYHGLLDQRQVSVDSRRALLSRLPVPGLQQDARSHEHIIDSWMGDDRWAAILMGGSGRSEDPFLDSPFEMGWNAIQNGERIDFGQQTDLLQDLTARVSHQETRLRKWKTFAASLRNTQEQETQTMPTPTSSMKPNMAMPQFDRHQSLCFSDQSLLARSVEDRVPTASVHKTLLVSMEAEIASLARHKAVEYTRSRDVQGTVSTKFTEERKQELDCLTHSQKLTRDVPDTISTVPILEPGSLDSKASAIPFRSQGGDRITPRPELKATTGQKVERAATETKDSASAEIPNGLPQEGGNIQNTGAHESSPLSALPTSSGHEQSVGTDAIPTSRRGALEQPLMPLSSSALSGAPSNSLAPENHDKVMEEQTEPVAFEPSETPLGHSANPDKLAGGDIHYMVSPPTLLERTRQSMSLLPNAPRRAALRSAERRASSKPIRMSQAFPVNQFETPRRMSNAESSQLEMIVPRSGSSTPRDDLFSDAAAYDSVFKSRPRIAVSPALSPDRSAMGLDSMLEEDLADLTLEVNR